MQIQTMAGSAGLELGFGRSESSLNGTISELVVFVSVRVSSNEWRNESLKAKPIRLRVARNSMASRHRMSSLVA